MIIEQVMFIWSITPTKYMHYAQVIMLYLEVVMGSIKTFQYFFNNKYLQDL